MKILEVTTKGNYSYEGKKSAIEWFWSYYRLLKLSQIKTSLSDFYKELPSGIRKQISRKKSPKLNSGLKLKYVTIDEIIKKSLEGSSRPS